MNNYCLSCDSEGTMQEKDIKIKVGSKSFPLRTLVCSKCKTYELTPEMRKRIDEWGCEQKYNFMKAQPAFSHVAHKYLDEYTKGKPLHKVQYMRIFTAVYLEDVVTDKDFKKLKELMAKSESCKMLTDGVDRVFLPTPLRYEAFRQMEEYGSIRSLTTSKVMEEAVLFCLCLITFRDDTKLRQIYEAFKRFDEALRDYERKVTLAS